MNIGFGTHPLGHITLEQLLESRLLKMVKKIAIIVNDTADKKGVVIFGYFAVDRQFGSYHSTV